MYIFFFIRNKSIRNLHFFFRFFVYLDKSVHMLPDAYINAKYNIENLTRILFHKADGSLINVDIKGHHHKTKILI